MQKYLYFCFLLLPSLLAAEYRLEYVSQISRHGARTPTTHAIDPFNTDWGVLERGDLTPVGMRQHYLLGVEFNRRYNLESGTVGKLYDDRYNYHDFFVQSSNKRRTIDSAYAQLQGLFPANKREQLTPGQAINARPPIEFNITTLIKLGEEVLPQNIQVVPVVAYDLTVDPIRPDWCPAYERMKDETKYTEEYRAIGEKYYQLRENVARVLGLSVDTVDVEYIAHLENALTARLAYGKDIGEFQSYYSQILACDYEAYVLEMTRIPTMLKIINTNYLQGVQTKFVSTIESAMKGERDSPNRLKFSFFSYHDDQQLQLCMGLGIDMKNSSPSYASTIIMQLWHDEALSTSSCSSVQQCFKQYYVKVKYNDDVALIPSTCHNQISQDGQAACRLDEWWQFVESEVIYLGSDIAEVCGMP